MSNEEKAVSRSVSLPESLWGVVDAHALADVASGDRSSYIRRLVTADLRAAGKLPGSPLAEVAELAKEAAEVVGADVVLVALRQLGSGKLAKAGEAA